MLYALKIAGRYLTSSKAQTGLLVLGVAVGVFIFIFMSALIGGLAELILARTVGDISHVTIQAEPVDPAQLVPGNPLLVQQKSSTSASNLPTAASFVPLIEALPGVLAVSPEINGSGFLTRGSQVDQVSINGLETGHESDITNLKGYVIEGTANLGAGSLLLGKRLADDLGLLLGQSVRLASTNGVETVLTVTARRASSGGRLRSPPKIRLSEEAVMCCTLAVQIAVKTSAVRKSSLWMRPSASMPRMTISAAKRAQARTLDGKAPHGTGAAVCGRISR
jgi:lipoprotein-releasing system permease protein